MPVYFAETEEEEMKSIVNININGTLDMTRVILPKMVERYSLLSFSALSGRGSLY
jgi:short-subunit dehydrogenase